VVVQRAKRVLNNQGETYKMCWEYREAVPEQLILKRARITAWSRKSGATTDSLCTPLSGGTNRKAGKPGDKTKRTENPHKGETRVSSQKTKAVEVLRLSKISVNVQLFRKENKGDAGREKVKAEGLDEGRNKTLGKVV